MKTILLTLAALTLTQAAHAEYRIGGNQNRVFLMCQGLENVPDRTLTVTLTENNSAMVKEMTVSHSTFAQVFTDKYFVTEQRSTAIGGSTSYVGQGVRLTVNFTTAPMQDGGHHAVLTRDSVNGRYMPEELSCQIIYHTM